MIMKLKVFLNYDLSVDSFEFGMIYFELVFNIFCLNLQTVSGDDSEDSDDFDDDIPF